MPRRKDSEPVTLTCLLSDEEQDFVATMMQMTGIVSQANIVRLALFHLAKHLDVPVGSGVFTSRGRWRGCTSFTGVKNRHRLHARQLPEADIDKPGAAAPFELTCD